MLAPMKESADVSASTCWLDKRAPSLTVLLPYHAPCRTGWARTLRLHRHRATMRRALTKPWRCVPT